MLNPYSAVLRIYWTRVRSWWVASTFVVIALTLLGTALALAITIALDPRGQHRIARQQICLLTTLGLGGLAFMIWSHFRDLVVGEYGCLWPGYRKPNLIVFAGLSAILFIVLPCTLSSLANADSPGLFAVAIVLFAANGWCAATRSRIIQFGLYVLSLGFWMMMTASPDSAMFNLSFPVAVGVIAFSVLVVIASCGRMVRLTEDSPAFSARAQLSSDITRPRRTGELNAGWREGQRWGQLGWLSSGHRAYLPKTDSLWDGARRWRSLNPTALLMSLMLVLSMMVTGAMPRFMFYQQQANWRDMALKNPQLSTMPAPTAPDMPQMGSIMLLLFLAMIPVIGVAGAWIRQWRFLEIESLRPIARGPFLKQIGLAIGIQMLQVWAVLAVGFVVDAAFIELGPVNILATVILLVGSLCALAFGYSLLAWALRYRRSATGAALLCGLAAVLFLGLVELGINDSFRVPTYMEIIPVILSAGGLYFVPSAYRRWLVTDLG